MSEKEPRPAVLPATTTRLPTGCGSMYIICTWKDGKMFEVFGNLGKAGGCQSCQSQGVTRCITVGLRHGVPPEEFIRQLADLSCPEPHWNTDGTAVRSCPDAISKGMRILLDGGPPDGTGITEQPSPSSPTGDTGASDEIPRAERELVPVS